MRGAILLSFFVGGLGVDAGSLEFAEHLIFPRANALSTADKPTQSGIAANCDKFYDVVTGDDCPSVEKAL